MKRTLKAGLFAMAACVGVCVSQPAEALRIEVKVGPIEVQDLYNIFWMDYGDYALLTFVYDTNLASVDLRPNTPSWGRFGGNFLVGVRLIVGGIEAFSCGRVGGMAAPTPCGGELFLNLYPGADPYDFASIDGTVYGSGQAPSANLSTDELPWGPLPGSADHWLNGDSIEQLPTPPSGGGDLYGYFIYEDDQGYAAFEGYPSVTSRYVSEPGSLALLGLGLAGLGVSRRRKANRACAASSTTTPALRRESL